MANRVGKYTAGAIQSTITSRLKSYTKKDVNAELWLDIINAKVDMIHEVLSSKDKAIYKDKVNLVSAIYKGFTAEADAGNTIDATNKILHLHKVTMSAVTTIAADMLNGKVLISCNLGAYIFENEIESIVFGTDTADVVLKTPITPSFASLIDEFVVIATSVNSEDNIIISGETWYKMVDQILSIYDSALNDECVNAETISNFYSMRKTQMGSDRPYRNSILYVRDGETLMFTRGAGRTAYGTRTMHYTRKPYSCTADTDIVDIPNANLDLLYSLCMLAGLQTIQVPIPSELKSAESQVTAMQSAKEKELAEQLANKGDN